MDERLKCVTSINTSDVGSFWNIVGMRINRTFLGGPLGMRIRLNTVVMTVLAASNNLDQSQGRRVLVVHRSRANLPVMGLPVPRCASHRPPATVSTRTQPMLIAAPLLAEREINRAWKPEKDGGREGQAFPPHCVYSLGRGTFLTTTCFLAQGIGALD